MLKNHVNSLQNGYRLLALARGPLSSTLLDLHGTFASLNSYGYFDVNIKNMSVKIRNYPQPPAVSQVLAMNAAW